MTQRQHQLRPIVQAAGRLDDPVLTVDVMLATGPGNVHFSQ